MRIAVVGAGLSGLMAARSLVHNGHDVVVFEKSRAPGGRTATRRNGEYQFDHGAQYFTQRDERLAPLMQQWTAQGLVAPWSATIAARNAGVWSVKSDSQIRWVAVPGMRALGVEMASTLAVQYDITVSALERNGHEWRLLNSSGDAVAGFDRVVVTAPAPQSRALLEPHSTALASQIVTVHMQPCIATMLVPEQRIDVTWDAAFVNDHEILSWVARNTSKPGRGNAECWVLHATPAWSEAHLESQPEHLATRMIDGFAELTGHAITPLKPQQVAHRWRYAIPVSAPANIAQNNPHNSNRTASTEALYDAASGLGAAGDWCVGGRVEGALLSGMAVADLVHHNQ